MVFHGVLFDCLHKAVTSKPSPFRPRHPLHFDRDAFGVAPDAENGATHQTEGHEWHGELVFSEFFHVFSMFFCMFFK